MGDFAYKAGSGRILHEPAWKLHIAVLKLIWKE
jgi:hypothetical protein